jgi:hypothetical protein
MTVILLIFLFFAPAFAQGAPTTPAKNPVCSNLPNITFQVKTESGEHAAPQASDGKALVYFLQDDTNFPSRPRPRTKLAIDGAWVGATHSDSYFYFAVDPGEHHLCAAWQAGALDDEVRIAAAHFDAEAGQVYYFRAQNASRRDGTLTIEFGRLDSDEAQLLIGRYALSSSSAKK